jgi:pyruvate dehydrogenase E1 component
MQDRFRSWLSHPTKLRRDLEIDRFHVARAAIAALTADGKMSLKDVTRAIKLYKTKGERPNPIGV